VQGLMPLLVDGLFAQPNAFHVAVRRKFQRIPPPFARIVLGNRPCLRRAEIVFHD
jgi:hypothetical protein